MISIHYPFSAESLRDFEEQGFLRLDDAFPTTLADEARAIIWRDTGCDPADPSSLSRPVIRLAGIPIRPS